MMVSSCGRNNKYVAAMEEAYQDAVKYRTLLLLIIRNFSIASSSLNVMTDIWRTEFWFAADFAARVRANLAFGANMPAEYFDKG